MFSSSHSCRMFQLCSRAVCSMTPIRWTGNYQVQRCIVNLFNQLKSISLANLPHREFSARIGREVGSQTCGESGLARQVEVELAFHHAEGCCCANLCTKVSIRERCDLFEDGPVMSRLSVFVLLPCHGTPVTGTHQRRPW